MNDHHFKKLNTGKVYAVQVVAALFLFIFHLLFGLAASAQDTNEHSGNFYAITGNGLKDTSWLFGTYHLVKSSYLNEVPQVLNAFRKSKGVIVELVIDSAKLPTASAMGMLKNKPLSELLDQPFKDSLDREVKSRLGIDITQINRLKPVNVALALSLKYLVSDENGRLQKYSGSMMDGYFAETGKLAGKKITSLETIEEQMNLLFNSSTDEEQIQMLKMFLRNKTAMIKQGNDMLEQWFNHDLNKMYVVAEKGLQLFGNKDDFLKNRNDRWMKVLPELVAKESQFIAVGALHLAGPDGLMIQLQQQGYTLTPIKL